MSPYERGRQHKIYGLLALMASSTQVPKMLAISCCFIGALAFALSVDLRRQKSW
jgi:hypothetical protein